MRIANTGLKLALAGLVSFSASLSAAQVASDAPAPRDFKAEKEFMVSDLTDKLAVIADTRACAMEAEDVDQLDACSRSLREAIIKQKEKN